MSSWDTSEFGLFLKKASMTRTICYPINIDFPPLRKEHGSNWHHYYNVGSVSLPKDVAYRSYDWLSKDLLRRAFSLIFICISCLAFTLPLTWPRIPSITRYLTLPTYPVLPLLHKSWIFWVRDLWSYLRRWDFLLFSTDNFSKNQKSMKKHPMG